MISKEYAIQYSATYLESTGKYTFPVIALFSVKPGETHLATDRNEVLE
jgi:hypothetical protein